MTKVTIIGEKPKTKKLNEIEFSKILTGSLVISDKVSPPYNYMHIELICLNYNADYDLMFAYDNERSNGALYLGKFNGGVA